MSEAARSTSVDDKAPDNPRRYALPDAERSSVLLNVVLLAAAILLGCIALEVALRVIFARSLDFSMEMWKYAVQLKRSCCVNP